MRHQLEQADLIRLYRSSLEHALKDAEAGDLWICDCAMCVGLQGDRWLYNRITRAAWAVVHGIRDLNGSAVSPIRVRSILGWPTKRALASRRTSERLRTMYGKMPKLVQEG